MLYAVATRDPQKLRSRAELVPTAWAGVYDVRWGAHDVRLIVLNAIDKHPRNAAWELFSIEMDRIRHGLTHYRAHSREAETLLYQLYLRYQLELPAMAYTLADFARESREHILTGLPLAERLEFFKLLAPEERRAFFKELAPVERRAFFAELSAEERMALLGELSTEERLRGLAPEERLQGLSREELERLKDILDQGPDN